MKKIINDLSQVEMAEVKKWTWRPINRIYQIWITGKEDFLKGEQSLRDLLLNIKQPNMGMIRVPERRERMRQVKYFKKQNTMEDKFTVLRCSVNILQDKQD